MSELIFAGDDFQTEGQEKGAFYIGTASDVSSDGIKILFDGHTAASEKRYRQIDAGIPITAGDRIVVLKLSGTYVILGRITNSQTPPVDISGKVSKTGDTMTGRLIIDNEYIQIKDPALTDGVTPQSSVSGKYLYFTDANGYNLGYIQAQALTNGQEGIRIVSRRKVNGSDKNHQFGLRLDASGNPVIYLSSVAAWLKALGLGDADGELPLTIAQGGSGQTEVESETTVGDVLSAATGWTVTSVDYKQWGKLAMLNVWATNSSAISANTTSQIATINSGKRPATSAPVQVWLSATNRAVLQSDGSLSIRGSSQISAETGFTFIAVYLLA